MSQTDANDSVETFPLSFEDWIFDLNKLPPDATDVSYHYTTNAGLQGILRSGGLRATYRLEMNDKGEFQYARRAVYRAIHQVSGRPDLPPIRKDLAKWVRLNLDNLLNDSEKSSDAFCACLTVSPDQQSHWRDYADNGTGGAIGINMVTVLSWRNSEAREGKPLVNTCPVLYNQQRLTESVHQLFEGGIRGIQRYLEEVSSDRSKLTELRNRITKEIIVRIVTFLPFIKDPRYMSESEIRLTLFPNDGTMDANDVQYYERDGRSIPYRFIDMRNRVTGRIPLAEIKVGPNASFPQSLDYVLSVLDEVGYGGGSFADRPPIVQSKLPSF